MHITVLMSVYNGASFLKRSVESIQKQSFTDWDLIIVDDASTDDSFVLLQDLCKSDSRISFLQNEKNQGLAYSMNRALTIARGPLIARMDCDDESMPSRFELQEQFLNLHPEVDVIGSAAHLVDERGQSLGIAQRPESHDKLFKLMYKQTPFFHSSIIARKEFYEKFGGYDEKLRFSQDADLWLRSYSSSCFHNLAEPLIRHRVRAYLTPGRLGWSIYVYMRRCYLDGLLFKNGWRIVLFIIAACLGWLRLRDHRIRVL